LSSPNILKLSGNESFSSFCLKFIIWFWALIIIFADLKVTVHPYMHWIVSIFLFFLILPLFFKLRFYLGNLLIFASSIFIFSILLVAFNSSNPLYDIEQAIKLIIIIIGGGALFSSRQFPLSSVLKAFISAVYINVILLIGGVVVSPFFASEMATGRWGTILNYPGSLWRVGISVFILAAYGAFLFRFRNLHYDILLLASLALIYFDGSRTGMLLLIIAIVFLVFLLLIERQVKIKTFVVGSVIVMVFLLLMLFPLKTISDSLKVTGAERFLSVVYTLKGQSQGFESVDMARIKMLETGINALKEHPFVGTGVGTTKANMIPEPMVVHMTYLQVWADIGVLGFASYIFLVWGWVIWLPDIIRRIRRSVDLSEKAIYYNSIFMLFVFGLSGFFHPLSTEWSEWIMFLFAYSSLFKFCKINRLQGC